MAISNMVSLISQQLFYSSSPSLHFPIIDQIKNKNTTVKSAVSSPGTNNLMVNCNLQEPRTDALSPISTEEPLTWIDQRVNESSDESKYYLYSDCCKKSVQKPCLSLTNYNYTCVVCISFCICAVFCRLHLCLKHKEQEKSQRHSTVTTQLKRVASRHFH